MTFVTSGLRLHFNRHGAAPLVWCISDAKGAWELAVAGFFTSVRLETVYAPKAMPDDEDGKPSAFLRPVTDVPYKVTLTGSWATIEVAA